MSTSKILLILWSFLFVPGVGVAADPGLIAPEEALASMRITKAYKQAATRLMIEEASVYIKLLHLQEELPLGHLTEIFVSPPGLYGVKFGGLGIGQIGGALSTTNYNFGFDANRGKLVFVTRFHPVLRAFDSPRANYEALAKIPSLIDTNGAYQLATQWLGSISVDVAGLQAKCLVATSQQRLILIPPSEDEVLGKVPDIKRTESDYQKVPIFNVVWGDKVSVKILGTTRELLGLRVNDVAFLKRPSLVLTNTEALLNIPDPTNNVIFKPARPKPANPPVQQEPPPL